MYKVQTHNIKKLNKRQKEILIEQCQYAAQLYNIALRNIKESFDSKTKLVTYYDNCKLCKDLECYKMLNSRIAQQTLKKASENFTSFIGLIKSNSDNLTIRKKDIHFPKYKPEGYCYKLIIVGNNVMSNKSIERGWYKFPLSTGYKKIKNIDSCAVTFPVPTNLKEKEFKQIEIFTMDNGKNFQVRYTYKEEPIIEKGLDFDYYLAIDTGVTNFATCVTSIGLRPFILDGKIIKNINYRWFKEKGREKKILEKQHLSKNSKKIYKITKKRKNAINDILNKYTRYIIDYCIEYKIGNIVLGYNKGIKPKNSFDSKNKRNFFYIPYYSFKNKLQSKCEFYGIKFHEQEESYTSKSSFIDNDILPEYVSNYNWSDNFSGKRIHRGLYKTEKGLLINADVNGAYNILRKCNQNFNIEKLDKGGLEPPIRIRL